MLQRGIAKESYWGFLSFLEEVQEGSDYLVKVIWKLVFRKDNHEDRVSTEDFPVPHRASPVESRHMFSFFLGYWMSASKQGSEAQHWQLRVEDQGWLGACCYFASWVHCSWLLNPTVPPVLLSAYPPSPGNLQWYPRRTPWFAFGSYLNNLNSATKKEGELVSPLKRNT